MTDEARACASCGALNPPDARFCNRCAAPLEAAGPASAETRKTVTVLFCDLVGSTAMGEQIDPETLRNLLSRSFDRVSAIIESHGGVVEKFIGDAAMAVFGIPRVHEDDALRAVRAAAEIREALGELAITGGSAAVAWRTGIATGEVVAGDAAAGSRLVTGDAVNVAARLQQTAQPGEILITAETQQLVRDAVRVEALGEVTVKGRQAPIAAFRLLEVDRSAAGHARRLDSPLVGRQRPRRLLDEAFSEVRDDRVCHLFTILGAAGVGKSRLVNEFIASMADQARVARGRCLSYGEGITYWPIAEIVREMTGIGVSGGRDITNDVQQITTVLGDHPDADRIAERIAQAIGLGQGERAPDEIPWAIRSFFEALAAERPLVVVLDDLHWGQPLLLDLVEHITDWTRDAPILLVVLARPELLELRPAWGGGKRSATTISLEPLNAAETVELMENLLGRADLPATVFERVRTAAEGNPLFVEELLEMLIDDGALARDGGRWTASRDLSKLTVPPTIHALLEARLDGLAGAERAVLERGAVEGTLFHREAVSVLAPELMRETVGPALLTLTRREFVAPDRAELVGREAYRFRHQLIRDAAYQAIAKQSRAELHERFAEWLAEALGDRIDEYRPILGYHLEQAARYRRELDADDPRLPDLARRAATHLGESGLSALVQSDFPAAYNLFQRAVALLPADSAEAMTWRLRIGDVVDMVADTATANAFLVETRELAERAGDRRAAALAETHRLWIRVSIGSETMAALAAEAHQLQDTLTQLADEEGAINAGLALAALEFWTGQAGAASEQALALLPRAAGMVVEQAIRGWVAASSYFGPMPVEDSLSLGERMAAGASAGVGRRMTLRHKAALLPMLGRFEEARAHAEEEEAILTQLGSPVLLSSLNGTRAELELLAGNAARAVEFGLRAYELRSGLGDRGFSSTLATAVARAYLELGEDGEAQRWAETALRDSTEDDFASQSPGRSILARVHARRGEHAVAETLARQAVALTDPTDFLSQVADAHDDLAEVLVAAGKRDEAVEEFRLAMEVYERKGHLVGVGRMQARLAELTGATPQAGPEKT